MTEADKYIPHFYKAAVSISLDFETSAQSDQPLLRNRMKSRVLKTTNKLGITQRDLSAGYGRGYGSRAGAKKIMSLFNNFKIKATWFCTGHVLIENNFQKDAFRINHVLPYAISEGGFTKATTWRKNKTSFFHEPFSDYRARPFYYMGDIARELKNTGHDIQCHSFSHSYFSMESAENIKTDLEDWQSLAEKNGFRKANIFAFPFQGDYHFLNRTNKICTIPYYRNNNSDFEIVYLNDEKLTLFSNSGFELFTRCGSMIESGLIDGFIPYRNSDIYVMKDIGIMRFKDLSFFKNFIYKAIEKRVNLDLWLHPNDILSDENFRLFKSFILELVRIRDKGEIWLCTISEQWEDFKKMKNISQ